MGKFVFENTNERKKKINGKRIDWRILKERRVYDVEEISLWIKLVDIIVPMKKAWKANVVIASRCQVGISF